MKTIVTVWILAGFLSCKIDLELDCDTWGGGMLLGKDLSELSEVEEREDALEGNNFSSIMYAIA
jgi:hypothetical protein